MRIGLAITVSVLALMAPTASAQLLSAEDVAQARKIQSVQAHPAECARLQRQIAHFQGMEARAKALDHEMYEEGLRQQKDLLRGLQAARCPNDVPVDTTAEALKQLLALAAKGALTYFTFGAAGF